MSSKMPSKPLRIPPWLRVKLPQDKNFACTSGLIKDLGLNTVCQSANCPNTFECFGKKVATFLIMGKNCTRNCAFCNIHPGKISPLDTTEPARVAEASQRLELKHVVITSVTRDDLKDGGSKHFAATIKAVRQQLPKCSIEVLIPDFQGNKDALQTVLNEKPDILNHNIETVPDLYSQIRPQADYQQSLALLERSKRLAPDIPTKSGLMLGLGETDSQVLQVIDDLASICCNIVTIGQYMRPSRNHPEVKRYVKPRAFDELAAAGTAKGIKQMFCAPLVRSSYNASKFV